MARKRMINPIIWQDPEFGKLTNEEKILFIGCFSNADDDGRLRGHPAYLRSIIFPYDDYSLESVEKLRNGIYSKMKNFKVYTVNGEEFIQFLKWENHQVQRDDRRVKSVFPSFKEELATKCQPNVRQMTAEVKLSKLSKVNIAEGKLPPVVPLKAKKEKPDPMAKIDLTAEIQKYIDSPQRHVHIAGLWLKFHPPVESTRGALEAQFSRNLRPAKRLVGYSDKRILDTFDFVEYDGQRNKYDGQLETVLKKIDIN